MAKTVPDQALTKGSRITGAQRESLAAQFGKRYSAGESIRKIAEDSGRSFGFVHGVLVESGVGLRSRGGATRGAAKKTASATKASATKKSAPSAPEKSAAKKSGSTTPTTTTKKATTKKA